HHVGAVPSGLHPSLSLYYYDDHRDLHSFPTRRSSDLHPVDVPTALFEPPAAVPTAAPGRSRGRAADHHPDGAGAVQRFREPGESDRKSTRLNSSHVKISYAVFCLKKKKRQSR